MVYKSKVAIIILSFNGEKYLPDCLDSLEKLTYPKHLCQIIIIDNASIDSSVDLIKQHSLSHELIESKTNLGFSGGVNLGWKQARELGVDYLILLNQDTIVEPDYVTYLVEAADSDPNIGACQSLVMMWPDKEKINSCGCALHYLGFGYSSGYLKTLFEMPQLQSDVGYASGASVLYRMSAIEQVGLFDNIFFLYHEDLDFSWKLRLAGYKVVLTPKSIVYHKYEFMRSIKKYYWMERNRLIVFFTNYKLKTIFLLLPAFLFMEFGTSLFSIKSGFWTHKLKAYLFFLKAQSWLYLKKRRQFVNSIRVVSDKHILSYMTGSILFQDINNPILKYIANPFFEAYFKLVKKIIWW